MSKAFRALSLSVAVLTLASCASTVELSGAAMSQRDQMTPQSASALAARYTKASATSGGLCMVGENPRWTHVDYRAPVTVTGPMLEFTGIFARASEAYISKKVRGVTGLAAISDDEDKAKYAVDLRTLSEIRLLEAKAGQFSGVCPAYKTGWMVVMKPEGGLPDGADISLNVSNQADLDTVLATLTYFSPKARVVGGLGL
ncbi:MAG TPA: hypothetical protein VKC56_09990 [Gallionellaceae bacterium]|nr:hypothetical protein [Gallionellaceae bacterium]